MARPTRVLLDTFDLLRASFKTVEVDSTDTTASTASAMSDCYTTGIVAAAFGHSLFGEGEREVGTPFPEVVFDGTFQVAETGGAGFVGSPDGVISVLVSLYVWRGVHTHSEGFALAGALDGGDEL